MSVYIATAGEVVLLTGLSSAEYNGALCEVSGCKNGRVAVTILGSGGKSILIQPHNIVDAGNDDDDDDADEEDEGGAMSCGGDDSDADVSDADEAAFATMAADGLATKAPPSSSSATKALLELAASKGRAGDAAGELATLTEAESHDPNNVHIVANIGVCHLDQGNYELALQYLTRAATVVDPKWALGRFHLARAYVAISRSCGGGGSASGAAADHVRQAKEQLRLAVTTAALRRHDESKQRASKTFLMVANMLNDDLTGSAPQTTQPAAATVHLVVRALLRSLAVLSQGQSDDDDDDDDGDDAETCEQERKTLTALTYFQLGKVLEQHATALGAGAADGAIGAYRRALAIDPSDPAYAMATGNALRCRAHRSSIPHDLAEAIAVYQAALAVVPDHAHLHRNLACAHMQKGDLVPAIASFQASLVHATEDDDPWKPQVTQIIATLTEKLRQHREGTFVVDVPNK
jgi:tetratricopeptide (TPR) repeat protein